ncbi:MAG TPA: class I SAM-dependent methyltransferase [Candidatus Bathyarchaeia archaeon]|nr:class I SAM-dependent methyltransferase [Candidatus Bathyarchaeia archaeon]
MTRSEKTHPWALAWREARWEEVSPPLVEVVEFAKDLKRKNARLIFDLGSGAGRHSIFLAKQGFQVVALDISETALKILEGRLRRVRIGNVTLVRHSMLDLPFVDDYFDGIVCTNVLHHGLAGEVRQAAREIHRVMKKGAQGFLVALSIADFRRGNGQKLEENTYVFTKGEERGIIHHFFTRNELESCLRQFRIASFKERLIPLEQGGNRAHFLVKLRKP